MSNEKNFWKRDAAFQKSVRYIGRRLWAAGDVFLHTVIAGVIFLVGQLTFYPHSSPVTFEQCMGEVESLELTGKNEVPTMSIESGDETTKVMRLNGEWSRIQTDDEGKVTGTTPIGAANQAVEEIYSNDQLGVIPAQGQVIKTKTWLPRMK